MARQRRTPDPGCSVTEPMPCPRPHYAKGLCSAHYQRAWTHGGDPLAGGLPRGEALAYYRSHVDLVTDECVPWPYGDNGDGYGWLWWDGRPRRVHTLACEHHHGPRPGPGFMALHRPVICHTRLCFNGLRHLYWGTIKQNAADMVRDGTSTAGERSPLARLTWAAVTEARTRYTAGGISQAELARTYRVDPSTMRRALIGETWRSDAGPDSTLPD